MMKLAFAAMLAFTAVPVSAEPVIASTTVHTADLDLRTANGQHALDRRLAAAVKEVCGIASEADLSGKNDIRRCRVETLRLLADERDQRIAGASGQPIEVAAR